MSAITKTKKLLRLDVPIGLLDKNTENPNKMSSRQFDLLCDNLEQTGLTDPILCRPQNFTQLFDLAGQIKNPVELAKAMAKNDVRLRIVGGHHRFDAACFIGFEDVPVTVIMNPEFDADMERFQIVRMNVIHGKMDPAAFYQMVQNLEATYADEVMQDSFGFADEAEFRKLIDQSAKSLPPELQKKFKEAAAEVKTIDGLSKLLNSMFTKYGDTLPYGYMVVDYGGEKSLWMRCEKKTMDALDIIAGMCIDSKRTMDDVIGGLVRRIAKGELSVEMAGVIADAPAADVPDTMTVAPTKDNLEKVASL